MSTENLPNIDIENARTHMQEAIKELISIAGQELTQARAYEMIHELMSDPDRSILGFQEGIEYDTKHREVLGNLLVSISQSPEYKKGMVSAEHLRQWQEIQGKVLIERLAPEIEHIAGDVLLHTMNSRTRVGDILGKVGIVGYAKAGIAAGSFAIMGIFQYRFLESLLHALAQYSIQKNESSLIVQLVQNHSSMMMTGGAWSVLTTCIFAYLVKTITETHLSDKLMGTKSRGKKTLCVLGCAALLGIEMTGSLSRITIGKDLQRQVIGIGESIKQLQ